MKIGNLEARIGLLEAQSGVVVLEDGSRFIPSSGLQIMRKALLFKRDTGMDPKLSDFDETDREQIIGFAKWEPCLHQGQLAAMVSDLARQIVARSDLS